MCGINGYIQFDGARSQEELRRLVHGMNERIVHRGPDHEGLYADDRCALGMRRLAIIDLAGGLQPIWNETRTLMIVFNGEIYNFRALRKELEALGHRFQTQSDTEVILHGFESHGLAILQKLEGMFAFAIYNAEKGEWVLARDRIGEKPLYYCKTEKGFLFGSELKSLMATGLVPRELDMAACSTFFQLTYIPAPRTIFQAVRKLEPATALVLDGEGNLNFHAYWSLAPNITDERIQDYDECKRRLREALFHSVEQRMISDVPLGAFLSGGFDSSIIVGIMAAIAPQKVDTFTIGFDEKGYDESQLAAIVAKRHHTNHTLLRLKWEHVLSCVDRVLENLDEPFGDSSLVATYAVSAQARQFVKVVLTGDAGDELFAGYNKYLAGFYGCRYKRLPKFLRKSLIEKMLQFIPQDCGWVRKAQKVVRSAELSDYRRSVYLMSLGFKQQDLQSLLHGFQPDSLDFLRRQYDYLKNADPQTRSQFVDLKTVLEGDMLPKVDRASMLASLETRVPLLDSAVVQLAYQIPTLFKINGNQRKIILKDTFRDMLPPELFSAPKHGFEVPVGQWLRGPYREKLLHYASPDVIEAQGLFDGETIRRAVNDHLSGRASLFSELWAFFVFQNWFERTISC